MDGCAIATSCCGPEARLVVFAPDYKLSLEGLFWYGHGDRKGLAALLAERAPANTIKATRRALDAELAAADAEYDELKRKQLWQANSP